MFGNFLFSVLLLVLECIIRGNAVLPKVCVGNMTVTGGSGVCCPIPEGSSIPCGGHTIGTCQKQLFQLQPLALAQLQDDRAHWPARFFKYTCKCEGNFFGLACNECWFGWEGRRCDKRVKRVRRNVLSFTPKERDMFVKIIDKTATEPTDYLIPFEKDRFHSDPLWKPRLLDVSLKDVIAFIHDYVSRGTFHKDKKACQALKKGDYNHNVIGFATWHRYYTMVWERELRKIAIKLFGWHDFAVPYWDWVDATECEVCVNSLVGAPGPKVGGIRLIHPESPFSKWTEYCSIPSSGTKCAGCHTVWPNFKPLNRDYYRTDFPTTRELQFALSRDKFYLPQKEEDATKCRGFHQTLEGFCGLPGTDMNMHNKVHNMDHGSFCCSPTAGNDPLFLLHHSQIDRIIQIWFEHYNPSPTDYPNHGVSMGNCRECNIIGFIPAVKHLQMFVDLRALGIYYDNFDFGKHGYRGDQYIKYGPQYRVLQ